MLPSVQNMLLLITFVPVVSYALLAWPVQWLQGLLESER